MPSEDDSINEAIIKPNSGPSLDRHAVPSHPNSAARVASPCSGTTVTHYDQPNRWPKVILLEARGTEESADSPISTDHRRHSRIFRIHPVPHRLNLTRRLDTRPGNGWFAGD